MRIREGFGKMWCLRCFATFGCAFWVVKVNKDMLRLFVVWIDSNVVSYK